MAAWLGIDIGTTHVKAVLVQSAYRKMAIARAATVDVGQSGSAAEAVRAAVARVLEGEPAPDGVAAALDGARAAVHRLLLPATAAKQMTEVLPYELAAQVPFDLDDAVFDWRVLELTRADGQLSIMAAVARVEDVRARIDLVRGATGHEPERIAVGPLSLAALVPAFPALSEPQT